MRSSRKRQHGYKSGSKGTRRPTGGHATDRLTEDCAFVIEIGDLPRISMQRHDFTCADRVNLRWPTPTQVQAKQRRGALILDIRAAGCFLQAASATKGYEGKTVTLKMNDIAPDFVAETTQGTLRLHEWMEADWVVLFSHPKAFTRICTNELTKLAVRQSEFVNRNVKLIGVGVDPVSRQMALAEKIREATGARMNFPIIGDPNREVLALYNMLATDGSPDEQSAANPEVTTVRSVFVFGPDKRIRLMLAYPMETARNFDEILRVIDSLRVTALHNTRTLDADGGDVALPIMSEEKTSRGRLGFKALFAALRHEILPF